MDMAIPLKAIETVYNGYRFRSRLEARWAVFFDALGIAYEYEKEGYDLGEAGWYLPDFWLPSIDGWVEIKGQVPTDKEKVRVGLLVEATGKFAHIFFGQVDRDPFYDWSLGISGHQDFASWGARTIGPKAAYEGFVVGGSSPWSIWTECRLCGHLGIYNTIVYSLVDDGRICRCQGAAIYDSLSPRLVAAYTSARSARFEYGENPGVQIQHKPPKSCLFGPLQHPKNTAGGR